ncbi:hypothetical protein HOLleu_31771 [Holothuria leucospilota]|uniref:Uncharacterized protein n=1 Tax=Holothuria leucospilota TaxID=206669 RepID=A0A9Q1BGH8_HOLLE|nr:hypothetical protein HOLleu_31771 [Holothuria leucospilota]
MRTVSGTTLLSIFLVFTMQCVRCKGGATTSPGIKSVTTAEGATENLLPTVETMKFTNMPNSSASVTERDYTSKEVTISDVSGNNGSTIFEESTTESTPTSKGVISGGTVTPTDVTGSSVYSGVITSPGITSVTRSNETTSEGATENLLSTVETMKFTNMPNSSTSVTEGDHTSKEVTISGVKTSPGITSVTRSDETTSEGTTENLLSTVETMKIITNMPNSSTSVTEEDHTSKEVTISDISGNNGSTIFEESATKSTPTSKGVISEETVIPTDVTESSVNPGRARNWVVICSVTIVAGLAILCTIALTWFCLKQNKLRKSRTNPVFFKMTTADSFESNENVDLLGIDNPLYNIDLELTNIQLRPSS